MKLARTLIALLFIALPALSSAAAEPISRDALKARQTTDNLVVVDVRTAEEFAAGHVAGAINIPHEQIAARAGELAAHKTDGKLVLYCRSGRRTALAVEALEKQGFRGLLHLDGDMQGWTAAGEPTVPCASC